MNNECPECGESPCYKIHDDDGTTYEADMSYYVEPTKLIKTQQEKLRDRNNLLNTSLIHKDWK